MIKCECLHHDLIFFVTTSIFGNKNNVSLKTTGHASWDLSRNEVNTPSGEQGNSKENRKHWKNYNISCVILRYDQK